MSEYGELREQLAPLELPDPHGEVLANGQEVLVSGDPARWAGLNHLQGENLHGQESTCGLVACEGILQQFGTEVSEQEMLEHALDIGRCDPLSGHTSLADQVALLEDFGMAAHTEHNGTIAGLAANIEHGQGVILEVNSGVLWGQADHYGHGQASHAVLVTGVARDPESNEVVGVFINDSATGESGRLVPREVLEQAWVEPGGSSIVTDAGDTRDEMRTIGDWVWYDGHWISF
jgi:hypothetical protein